MANEEETYEDKHNPGQAAEVTPAPPESQIPALAPAQTPSPATTGELNGVKIDATEEAFPQVAVLKVEPNEVIFVPFEDFTGRINQDDFNFRKDIPTKVPKAEANVWLEAKKGYIK